MRDLDAYEWRTFTECNMCGASAARARTIGRRLGERQGWRPKGNPDDISTVIQRCRACGLVFANPMPLPVDIDEHYGIPAEDYWHESELPYAKDYFASQLELFRSLNTRSGPLSALDIGAGVGKGMVSLEAAGFDTYGLEPSSRFRQRAISQTGVTEDRLRLARIEDADYPEGRFDLVTFGAVLEHLADPAAAIATALRWTRPGGLLHVEVPSSAWLMARLVDFAYRIQRLDLTCHLSPLHVPFHLFEFTRARSRSTPRGRAMRSPRAGATWGRPTRRSGLTLPWWR